MCKADFGKHISEPEGWSRVPIRMESPMIVFRRQYKGGGGGEKTTN